jgi:hypothetical protein
VRGIEVDDTHLYWCEVSPTEGNVVRAAPKDGSGPVRTLGEWFDYHAGRSLALDDRHVYWLRPENGGVLVRLEKSTATRVDTALPQSPIGRLDLGPLRETADSILIATKSCSQIIAVSKAGAAGPRIWEVTTREPAGGVTGLEANLETIFCSNGAYVYALDRGTGSTLEIVGGQRLAGPLRMVGNDLYFVNDNGSAGDANGELRVLLGEEGAPLDLGQVFGHAENLLYDEQRQSLYWVTGLHWFLGKVAQYAVGGDNPPSALLEGQDVMGSSAADSEYLYWLSTTSVTRLKK